MLHALHGNVGLPDDLLPLLQTTGREFRAWHLWDWLRGHEPVASLLSFAAVLNVEAGTQPKILLGYSLGGRLALNALTLIPGKWDAAIFLSTHPGLFNAEQRRTRFRHDKEWARRFRTQPWKEVMAAWNSQAALAGDAVPQASQDALENYRHEMAKALDVWSLGRQLDLRRRLPFVTCPVLWITGAQDEKFTDIAAVASQMTPLGQHIVIPDAGHRVHLDQPQAVADAICTFLHNSLPAAQSPSKPAQS